ncbi:hypothetical protein AAHE18_U039100 [Arachis hypogaea]
MDLRKCKPLGGVSSQTVTPLSVSSQMNEMARSLKDVGGVSHAIRTDIDIDLREVYFLIMHFLSAGPCQKTLLQFWNELQEHQLLPRRYHAWYSRSGLPGEDAAEDDDGISFPLSYNNLLERYPHIAKDHLVKLLKQLMLNMAHPLHGKVGGSSPNAADVPTLLGYGSFSLLDVDRETTDRQIKPPPVYLRWPHMEANQVQGLSLREIGGGFAKHHRAPSIRSVCYAIAKPSTLVQKMQNIKKLRGHRVAVYCAIFDRSGRYVISGSDDRLVKIWSMETAFCLASCRGHEGDITDLAVSSNNALVASASNDFVIRVWHLPNGMPISVLRGHTGAVNTIAFSPRPNAYELLSASDDGTCRIWDARHSQKKPRIYLPRPSDAVTGRSSGAPANVPSSSNGQQSHQILCCAFNANGTVFVTGSSDTYARVWNAFKSNSEDSEQPIHEMDVLAGHENDVNYVQFSGCSVPSKFLTADPWREENNLKLRNYWYCHDNIVTCSRDGSAIIWVPRSRRSHGKVGRWVRAYHLKVPPPPLPPQPPRGGPRQRPLPTPRGVNMIVWSLDNRFVLAAIMDCRICVWNAVDGSLVHSLTGHSASSYVLDVHPFNPRIAMSAGYDGRTIVWDIWEGVPVQTYELGRFKLVDGKFSPDGTSIVLSDDVGQIYFVNTGQGESQKDAKYDQFFLGDYRPLIQDTQGNVLDQETQLPPHRRNIQEPLCDSSMLPYPEPYQTQFQQRRHSALGIEWRPSLIKYAVGPDFSVGQDYQVLPLPDLEGMVEPQAEFIDAVFWEPEYEIVSDDNDSEYNVNEDHISAAERGSISAISSSDLESSEDSGNRDSLRRSRRKKHNVDVEAMTSSGRRVRKRNLNECVGNPSGSSRNKKSKGSLKSSKRKSSKAKALRPQRTAARNARNMFSQIGETSTDGDDDDHEDESSDSLQDSDISEPERKMHGKHDELKRPALEEFANVVKSPVYSEPPVNVENRRRLVLKFSLSKKTVPLEDTTPSCETHSNMLCDSEYSRHQESTENTLPESSIDPALSYMDVNNVQHPESHNRNECSDRTQAESSINHTETRRQKHALPILEDALQTDTEFDGHLEHDANGSEHMVNKLEAAGSMINQESADHYNVDDLSCGYNKLNDGDKGQSGFEKQKEGSQKTINISSSHSLDHKMKAPMKSTKIVIKKKQISADNVGPCRLKIVSSNGASIGARGDVVSRSSSVMDPNLVINGPEGEDGIKLSSPQLRHSYSDRRSYDHAHERRMSYKGEANPDGLACNWEEHTSTFSNQSDSENGESDVVSDTIRRTRSTRMKTNSDEPSSLNIRIKTRGSQNSRALSGLEGSSIRGSDQLHRGTRSSRNRREYVSIDPGILTRKMSNRRFKKLSWLMLSEHEEGYRYIPQLGDEVVYLRQGHQEYIELMGLSITGPWRSFSGLRTSEICKVDKLEYAAQPGSGDSCCKLTLRFIDPSSPAEGKSFQLTLPELINFSDFVIERTWYEASMNQGWSSRDKCMVWWKDSDSDGGGNWWEGRIMALQDKSPEFPDSPWLRCQVQYKTEPGANYPHSPWELYDPDTRWVHPHIDKVTRDKLLSLFAKLDHRDKYSIQALEEITDKTDFSSRYTVQFHPELIQARLKNDYYRSVDSVKHDITVMLMNAEDYFKYHNNVQMLGKIKRLQDYFRKKLERI